MKRYAAWTVLATLPLLAAGPATAKDCGHAGQLVKRAAQSEAVAEALLRRAVAACPDHLAALNNLALKLESQGRLDEAERLYRHAIAVDAVAPAPHAGLGDVLAARGDRKGAADAYKAFLARLADLRRTGNSSPLFAHENVYEKRLASLSGDVVTAETITRSLTRAPAFPTRGLGISRAELPSIDLHIRFQFDSARLQPKSLKQLEQVSRALKSKKLRQKKIRIEGHTDSAGADAYNLRLSKRRSATVRTALIDDFKIDARRLTTAGHGEAQPIADNGTDAGRAANRRVTFINLDAGG